MANFDIAKEAACKAADDVYLAQFRKLCEKYSSIKLNVKELCHDYNGKRFGAIVVDQEDRDVFAIITASTSRPRIEDFEKALKIETAVREFRSRNIERVVELQKKVVACHLESLLPLDWRGKEICSEIAFKNPSYWLPLTHQIYFDQQFVGWTEEGLSSLEKHVLTTVVRIDASANEAMAKLKMLDISGVSVEATGSELKLDKKIIQFTTPGHAKEAEAWALDHGAFLPWHCSLGEWAQRAKKEGWDVRYSKLVLALINSEPIEEKRYTVEGQYTLWGKGTGRFYQSSEWGWFLANYHLRDNEIESLKSFAKESRVGLKMLNKKQVEVAREEEERRKVFEDLKVRICVLAYHSRKASTTIVDEEGSFEGAIQSAKSKINPQNRPRRSMGVSIYQVVESTAGPRRIQIAFSSFKIGKEVLQYLENLKKEDLKIEVPRKR